MLYPANDWQGPPTPAVLGGFFDWFFPAQDQVSSLIAGRSSCNDQVLTSFSELLASVSANKIRPTRRQNLTAVPLSVSDRGQTVYDKLRYGSDTTHGAGHFYGETIARDLIAYKLPASAPTEIRVLTNRLSAATLTLVAGIDFIVSDGHVLFFNDPALLPEVIVQGGQFTLWAIGGEKAVGDLYDNYGFILGPRFPDTEAYRRWIEACLRVLNYGGTRKDTIEMIASALDVPVAAGDETVLRIFSDTAAQWIITDKNAYRCGLAATAIVTVGATLTAGQLLTDTIAVVEFKPGASYQEITSLALGDNFLNLPGWTGFDLVFQNVDKPTVVDTSAGFTRIEFDLRGNPGDVRAFWDSVHARGISSGKTLAMCLDTRSVPDGQPTATALPATINPVKFLFDNFFRRGLAVIKLKAGGLGPQALGFEALHRIHSLTQPGVCYLFSLEFSGQDEALPAQYGQETLVPITIVKGADAGLGSSYAAESGAVSRLRGRCV